VFSQEYIQKFNKVNYIMAIDLDKTRWASIDSVLPEDGLPNKSVRPSEFKDSGLKNNQPLPLQWLNGQFNDIQEALKEAQSQIDAIVGGSSQPTLEAIYPVDSLYMSFSSTSPATVLSFGTWTALEGKFLVGVDSADSDFDTAGDTGGAKSHTHTDNFSVDGHVLTEDQMPSHTHTAGNDAGSTAVAGNFARSENNSTGTITTSPTGGDSSHTHGLSGGVQSNSNLPPYTCVFMWRRTS
jgi:hypothetical protein